MKESPSGLVMDKERRYNIVTFYLKGMTNGYHKKTALCP